MPQIIPTGFGKIPYRTVRGFAEACRAFSGASLGFGSLEAENQKFSTFTNKSAAFAYRSRAPPPFRPADQPNGTKGEYNVRDTKNNFEKSFANRPKAPIPTTVVGERGRTDLPPGTKGGENLTPDRHYEHKQHTFDSFCKKAIKNEALNAYTQIRYRLSKEVSLSALSEETMEQLAAYDRYPWEYTSFVLDGDVILIENDHLADALNALPVEYRNILLMYYFLELADREIAERLHLARKTVNNRRLRSCRLLKELMGGEAE